MDLHYSWSMPTTGEPVASFVGVDTQQPAMGDPAVNG